MGDGYTYNYNNYIKKIGRIVITCLQTSDIPSTGTFVLANIPDGFRPAKATVFTVIDASGGTCTGNIGTDGKVTVYNGASKINTLNINATYLTS